MGDDPFGAAWISRAGRREPPPEPKRTIKRRRDHARISWPEYEPSPEWDAWSQEMLRDGWMHTLDDIQAQDYMRAMREPRGWQRDWARRRARRKRNHGCR